MQRGYNLNILLQQEMQAVYLSNTLCWDIFKMFSELPARVIQPMQLQLPPPPLARLTYDIYCIIASKPNLVTAATKFFFSKGHRETHPSGSPSNRQPYDWGTSTVKCLLSIAKAAPPVPATRGAESSYIPDPLSHPSLLHLLLPRRAQQQPTGQQESPFSKPRNTHSH